MGKYSMTFSLESESGLYVALRAFLLRDLYFCICSGGVYQIGLKIDRMNIRVLFLAYH
jgi:hypothetical protein